eukprot:366154-Chlamydomonas_euryale.AAC.1
MDTLSLAGDHGNWTTHVFAYIYGQFTYGLNASMMGIVAACCDPAAAQWAVVRMLGMPENLK